MREVTNLAWPLAPYSTQHRPVQREVRLLTGVAIGMEGWAVVHLPVDRTRTLLAAQARLGIHAVHQPDDSDPRGWLALEQILLEARRQATAIGGQELGEDLAWVSAVISTNGGGRTPGLTTLFCEWPAVGTAPAKATAAKAQLIELDGQALSAGATALAEYPTPHLGWGTDQEYLTSMAAAAAAVAFAAAEVTGRYSLDEGLPIPGLLDAAAGDLLPFAELEPSAEPMSRRGVAGAGTLFRVEQSGAGD